MQTVEHLYIGNVGYIHACL